MSTIKYYRPLLWIGILTIIVSFSSIYGYFMGVEWLYSGEPGLSSMTVHSGRSFLVSGVIMVLLAHRLKIWARVLSFILIISGLLSIIEHIELGHTLLSELLEIGVVAKRLPQHQHMSLHSSLLFFIMGIGFIGVDKRGVYWKHFFQWCFHFVTGMSFLAIIGYFLMVPEIYRFSLFPSIALQTAVTFFVLSIGASMFNYQYGITGIFSGNALGNEVARRQFPLFFLVILSLTILRLKAQRENWVDMEFGLALYAISFLVASLTLVWYMVKRINRLDNLRLNSNRKAMDLESREQMLANLLESAPDMVIITNDLGQIQRVNEQLELVLGYEQGELVGKDIDSLVEGYQNRPVINEEGEVHFSTVKTGLVPQDMESYGLRRDGSKVPLEIRQRQVHTSVGVLGFYVLRDITRRKEDERKIKESEELYRYLYEHANEKYVRVSLEDGVVQSCNATICRELGYASEELIGKPFYELFAEEDQGLAVLLFEQFKEEHYLRFEDLRLKSSDGTINYVIMTISLVAGINQDQGYGLVSWVDVSELKNTQDALSMLVEQFEGAFENSAIGMALVGIDLKWLRVNKCICDMLGYTQEELMGRSVGEVTHPEDVPPYLEHVRQLVSKEIESCTDFKRFYHKDGRMIWAQINATAVFNKKGEPLHLICQAQDITDKKLAEETLRKTNAEQQAILDSGYVAIIVTDVDGKITHANKGAEEMLGYSREEIIALGTPLAFHEEEELQRRWETMRETTGVDSKGYDIITSPLEHKLYESKRWTYIKKTGERFSVLLVTTAIRQDDNTIVGYVGIATDVSELDKNRERLKKANQEMEKMVTRLAEKKEQLARFAHITSHNLRAPVSNLTAILDIYHETEDEEDKKLLFEKFEKVILHLSDTLNELVDALRIHDNTDLEYEEVTLTSIVERACEMLSGQIMNTSTHITTDFSEVDTISTNKMYIDSIIQNLLSNAIKYRDPNRKPEIRIHSAREGDKVKIQVGDNGLGIDMEKNGTRLFGLHKTFHRHPDAKGVGLFLVKMQVESMGGTIEASSIINTGTVFTIRLPLRS